MSFEEEIEQKFQELIRKLLEDLTKEETGNQSPTEPI